MSVFKPSHVSRKVKILAGHHTEGRVRGVRETSRGQWVDVNVSADKKKPLLKAYRPVHLELA